jgi:hypothetical protein
MIVSAIFASPMVVGKLNGWLLDSLERKTAAVKNPQPPFFYFSLQNL